MPVLVVVLLLVASFLVGSGLGYYWGLKAQREQYQKQLTLLGKQFLKTKREDTANTFAFLGRKLSEEQLNRMVTFATHKQAKNRAKKEKRRK